MSWELYVNSNSWIKEQAENWNSNTFQLFVQLAPQADMNSVSEKIKKVISDNAKTEKQFNPEVFLHPMADWHLKGEWKEGRQIGGRIQMVRLFGIIGAFVLLLACINFMNLSTARSEKRIKEAGIRMVIGSVRVQLITQFLSESFLVVMLAFIMAIGLTNLCLPWFNSLADKRIPMEWANPFFWLINFAFVLLTSILAASYSALSLCSFRPIYLFKGS